MTDFKTDIEIAREASKSKILELAKQKLDFLKTCNCKEYFELKNILNKN